MSEDYTECCMMKNILLVVLMTICGSEKVVINSTNTCLKKSNKWTVHGNSCGSAFLGTNTDKLKLCNAPACSLWSQYYETLPAGTLYLTINMETRSCQKFPSINCAHATKLQIHTASSCSSSPELKEEILIPPNPPLIINEMFEQRTFTVEIRNMVNHLGMFLAFEADGFCGEVKSIQVYFFLCKDLTVNLVDFHQSAAPSMNQLKSKVYGICIANAIVEVGVDKPHMMCYYNGTREVYGRCVCAEGFEMINDQCQVCPDYTFKSEIGNQRCNKCRINSKNNQLFTKCICMEGFFKVRTEEDIENANCYAPPSAVSHIEVFNLTSNSATISWKEGNVGSNPNGMFKLVLLPINREYSTAKPAVTIMSLGAYGEYEVIITKENNITRLVGIQHVQTLSFRTSPGAPGPVTNVQETVNTDGVVTLKWKEPSVVGSNDLRYHVSYGSKVVLTKEMSMQIEKQGYTTVVYNVKITAIAFVNGTEFARSSEVEIDVKVKGGVPLSVALGGTAGGMALVSLVLLAAFFVWRKRHPRHLTLTRVNQSHFFTSGKIYIDPTTYSHLDEAVYDFTKELSRNDLTVGQLLGGGEYAEVFLGSLSQSEKTINVAVKILRKNSGKVERDDFISEAAILGQFNDPNVVYLEGVVLKDTPNLIVLEFMENGSLDKYLQNNDMEFTVLQLLGMARGVSSGMAYLSELGYIHRDLAARNILVNEHNVCKVADFGMSRMLTNDTYDTRGGKIPIRWTAPEAIQFKKFTTASDVWSFGVLLWEIMSYAERPYWDWSNFEVMERIASGYRLPPPMHCSKIIHDLMLSCWIKERTKRPKFVHIRSLLEDMIKNPNGLSGFVSTITKSDENLDYSIMDTIENWLSAIKMEQYTKLFTNASITSPKQVLQFNMAALQDLGIEPIGHRKKILKAIINTKEQIDDIENGFHVARSPSATLSRTLSRKFSYLTRTRSSKKLNNIHAMNDYQETPR